MNKRMAAAPRWFGVLAVLPALCASVGEARTFIVNPDTTGQHAVISVVADSAQPGDSIMVRDGIYVEAFLSIDSAVVVFAEHNGGPLIICVTAIGITLHQSAQLWGFQIQGFFELIDQFLVEIRGGPATIYNCQFWPDARQGVQLSLFSAGVAPMIRYCQFFTQSGASAVVQNFDSTTVWMPYNYFQRTDTVAIHRLIWDSSNGLGLGHVYITPVLDSFQWLGVTGPERDGAAGTHELHPYPNPSRDGRISLDVGGTKPIQGIDVYNLLGQRVWSWSGAQTLASNGSGGRVFLSAPLSSGTYFLVVTRPQLRQTAKISIIH